MLNGKTDEINQAGTQQFLQAATHLHRASDALMAVQPLASEERRERIRKIRALIDQEAIWLDQQFQLCAEAYFRG